MALNFIKFKFDVLCAHGVVSLTEPQLCISLNKVPQGSEKLRMGGVLS